MSRKEAVITLLAAFVHVVTMVIVVLLCIGSVAGIIFGLLAICGLKTILGYWIVKVCFMMLVLYLLGIVVTSWPRDWHLFTIWDLAPRGLLWGVGYELILIYYSSISIPPHLPILSRLAHYQISVNDAVIPNSTNRLSPNQAGRRFFILLNNQISIKIKRDEKRDLKKRYPQFNCRAG